jgi:hypothetical protein
MRDVEIEVKALELAMEVTTKIDAHPERGYSYRVSHIQIALMDFLKSQQVVVPQAPSEGVGKVLSANTDTWRIYRGMEDDCNVLSLLHSYQIDGGNAYTLYKYQIQHHLDKSFELLSHAVDSLLKGRPVRNEVTDGLNIFRDDKFFFFKSSGIVFLKVSRDFDITSGNPTKNTTAMLSFIEYVFKHFPPSKVSGVAHNV